MRDSEGIRELSVDTTNKKEAVKRFRDYYGLKGKHIKIVDMDKKENSIENLIKKWIQLDNEIRMLENS